jgi:hypothetical protein
MDALYPRAQSIPFLGAAGGSYVSGAPFRGVLHTTQTKDYTPSPNNYYGHLDPPHFTVAPNADGDVIVYQHYSVRVSSRALVHAPGALDTNRMGAIQIEICWTAEEIATLPQAIRDVLRPLMRWIELQAGIHQVHPPFLGVNQAYGEGSETRMSTSDWSNFNGWCGHQHVPENVHWDPGPIDIAYLLT